MGFACMRRMGALRDRLYCMAAGSPGSYREMTTPSPSVPQSLSPSRTTSKDNERPKAKDQLAQLDQAGAKPARQGQRAARAADDQPGQPEQQTISPISPRARAHLLTRLTRLMR